MYYFKLGESIIPNCLIGGITKYNDGTKDSINLFKWRRVEDSNFKLVKSRTPYNGRIKDSINLIQSGKVKDFICLFDL